MKAILVLVGMAAVAYGVFVLLITTALALQVDPQLQGDAWRAAVMSRLTGTFRLGLVMGFAGLVAGVGLIGWVRWSSRGASSTGQGPDLPR